MKDLPEGWKESTLGEISEFINGRAFKPSEWEKDGKLIIRIQDLTGSINDPHYSTENYDQKYLVKKGDLLISWSATLDAFIWDREDGWLNQHIFKVNENKQIIDRKFLFYLVRKKIDLLKKQTHGSTMKHITKKNFDRIKIPLPPLPTQKKIVAILEKAEKLKGWRREADELTDELLKSTFFEMFGDPVKNPIGWSVKKIKEVIVDIQAGWSVNGESKPRLKNEFAVLKVSAVTSGVFLPNECKVINEKDLKKIVTPEKRDVLFSRANTLELVGATCLITENYPFLLLPDKLWKIKVEKKYILPEYLKFVLSHSAIRKKISALSTGTSGSMYNISMKKFSLINITVPPIEIQDEFVKIVEKDEQIRKYQIQSSQHIEDLFNALMQHAFRGELS